MFILFIVLIVIVCVLTILIVLVQNSKGGGLAANFSSSNQIMGVRKTTDFLEKATWTLGAALILFSLLAGITLPGTEVRNRSILQDQFDESTTYNVDPQAIDLPSDANVPDQGDGN